jgi:lycopene cyclase CruP
MLEILVNNLPQEKQYYWHRLIDKWRFGSGSDYHEQVGEHNKTNLCKEQ